MNEINFDKTPSRSERIKEKNEKILESFKQKDADVLKQKSIKEHTNFINNQKMDEEYNFINKGKIDRLEKKERIANFGKKLKESLITSALNVTFDKVASDMSYTVHEQNIGHSMIEKFVNEMGTENLLYNFKKKNLILSEYAFLINETFDLMIKEAYDKEQSEDDIDDNSTYIPDKSEGKKFIDNVMSCTPGKVPIIIQDRVQKSVQDFVDQNVKNKEAIKDIYAKAKDKINKPGNEKYQEEINFQAKKDVEKIYNESTSLLEMMVRLNSESIIKDDILKEHYLLENNSLDYNSILKDTVVMYTVLETVNVLGLIEPDKKFISKLLDDLK